MASTGRSRSYYRIKNPLEVIEWPTLKMRDSATTLWLRSLIFSAEEIELWSYGFLRELVDEPGFRALDEVVGLRADEVVAGFGAVLAGVLDLTGALRVGAGRDRTAPPLDAGDGRRTVVERVALRDVGFDLEVERAEGIDLLVVGVARRAVAGAVRDEGVDLLVMGVARRAVGV